MSDWDVTLRNREVASNIASDEVVDLLASLVEKNLVVAEGDRYRLLETVRQYGRGWLNDAGESESIRERHLACFLALAQEAEPHLTGQEQQSWLDRLDAEHDNLRAALDWSLNDQDEGGRQKDEPGLPYAVHPSSIILHPSELGLRLAGAVWRFWYVRGYFGEGRRRLSLALDRPCAKDERSARAKAQTGAGTLAALQGDFAAARALHEESLALRHEIGDMPGIANSLANLGSVANIEGDYDAARALFEQCLSIRRAVNDRPGIALLLNNLGSVAYVEGDYPAARAFYEESLTIKRELGDRYGIAQSLGGLGELAHHEGDFLAARALHEESLAMKHGLGYRLGIAESLESLGELAWSIELPERAARLWGAAESLRKAIGSPHLPAWGAEYDLECAAIREALGEAAFDSAFSEGRAMTLKQAVEYALRDGEPDREPLG